MKKIILVATLSILFSGCVTDPVTGEQKASKTAIGTAIGAAAGAIGGGTIGKGGGKRARNTALGGAVIGGAIGAILDSQEKKLKEASKDSNIDIERTADNKLKITIPENITFPVNRYDLSSFAINQLRDFGTVLQEEKDKVYVTVVGHTDSTGNDRINYPLSKNRANAVGQFLSGNGYVYPNKVITQGVGPTQPIASNSTVDGRQQNRRVEIFLDYKEN